MSKVSGKVTKVESKGLYIKLENGKDAFLPKENMFIGKKKKLEEIFSIGFVIKAEEKSTKDSLVILTQKELKQAEGEKKKVEKNSKEKQNKKKNKPKAPIKKEVKEQPEAPKKQEVQEENQEPKQETKTLKDLKKLQFIGNMKISVGKGKKSNITELSEEKEEKKEIPPAPEGLLENIISTTKQAEDKFEKIKKGLQERGYLDGY
ncbi:S1 RNA-binding domain-containing protein [Gemella haemolysans]|uniref:S1 RNA-binding domain-containing protein n=1 Tax=Gemella haemolysans TaxID=1379 RepID=UPI00232C469F|nr:S1 RNA-binding domain-containing protein [Gemella haemolysans]MDB6213996.1 S1 RNA-binding domain-containing protein [Gemella haemolysans]